MGLEPTPGPWQGPVLPLYYGRPKHENSSTSTLHRQVLAGTREKTDAPHPNSTRTGQPYLPAMNSYTVCGVQLT